MLTSYAGAEQINVVKGSRVKVDDERNQTNGLANSGLKNSQGRSSELKTTDICSEQRKRLEESRQSAKKVAQNCLSESTVKVVCSALRGEIDCEVNDLPDY